MNAYETPLAELLKTVPKDARFVEEEEFSSTYHPVGRLCHEAADRIAELEKDRDRLFKAHSAEMVRADKQADYIAQLEKGLESSIAMNKAQAERQVKELTNAEIRTIQDMCHLKNVGYNTFIMRFARAILKKAQEK